MAGQPSLFDLDRAGLRFHEHAPSPGPAWLEEQLPLFEGKAPLVGELEAALWDADFERAAEAFERLRETYPDESSIENLGFVAALPRDFWSLSLSVDDRLLRWECMARALGVGSIPWRKARNGFFRRLCSSTDVASLAASHPEAAPDVANSLYDNGETRASRIAVREALLAGRELRSLDFEDVEVAELLSEDEPAAWLASLGAIRLLWPRHLVEPDDASRLETEISRPLPDEDRARALDFWKCLCISGLGKHIPESIRLDSHRRMKRLHPRLHAEFMGDRSS